MDIVFETKRALNALKSNSIKALSEPLWSERQVKELLDSPFFVKRIIDEEGTGKLRKILKPFIFDSGRIADQAIKKIYCKFVGSSKNDNEEQWLFSALTQEMTDADNAFFNDDKQDYSVLDIIYKPYIYLLSVKFKNNDKKPDIKEDCWYIVELNKPALDSSSDNSTTKDKRAKKRKSSFSGFLSFSASPFVYEEVYATFKGTTKTLLPRFDNKYPVVPSSQKDISKQFKKLFKSVDKSELRIYQVGQAEAVSGWNLINGKYHEFAFDLGYPVPYNLVFESGKSVVDKDKSGTWEIDNVRKLNPELIMISHWHMDHYLASGSLNLSVFNGPDAAVWIAPEYDYSKMKDYCTDRLVAFLIKKKQILFFPKSALCVVDKYMLCRGTGDNKNANGLILSLNKVLLTADCDCQFWPDTLLNHARDLQYLTVPHHGSGVKFDEKVADANIDKIFIDKLYRANAYICVGHNNWGHPYSNVVDYYRDKKKFNVLITNDSKLDTNELMIADK